MRLTVAAKHFFCWLFISTLLLTTVQITVAGYGADENSWFRILTTVLAEEESEDSEREEESKCAKEYTMFETVRSIIEPNKYLQSLESNQFYFSLIREVFSPPPEA